MKIFALLLRNTSSWLAAAVGAILAWIHFRSADFFGSGLQGAFQSVNNSFYLLVPLLCLAACIDSQRLMRNDDFRLLMRSFGAARAVIMAAAAFTLPGLLAVASLLLAACVRVAEAEALTWPGAPSVVLSFAWVPLAVSIGLAIGRVFPAFIGLPISLLFSLVAPLLLANTPDTTQGLFTFIDDGAAAPPVFLRADALWHQVMIVALMTWMLQALVIYTLSPARGSDIFLSSAIVALVAVLVIATAANPVRRYIATGAEGPRQCATTDAGSVCVWANHKRFLAALAHYWQTELDAAPSWSGKPSELTEVGLSHTRHSSELQVGTTLSGPEGVPADIAMSITHSLYCDSSQSASDFSGQIDRQQWLLVHSGLVSGGVIDSKVSEILTEPLAEQEQWWLDPFFSHRSQSCM